MTGLRPASLAALAGAALACSPTPYAEVAVDFGPGAVSSTAQAPASSKPVLRFSVAAIQSPQDTFSTYSRFFTRMGQLLGADVRFVQRRTYVEVDDMLIAGQLDAALVCTGGYLDLQQRAPGQVEVLAVPVTGGQTTYRSLLLVPAASSARGLADLAGKRFAFTDELSLSGHLYAAHLLSERGEAPERFFGSTLFTRSHDRSVDAVAKGLVDGASVDSLVYEALLARDPGLGQRTRVIDRSPPFGVMPVLASTRLPAATRARLRAVLLALHEDPGAAAAMATARIERFVAPAPGLYDDAREVARKAR